MPTNRVAAAPFHRSDFHLVRPPGLPARAYWEIVESAQELERPETSAAKGFEDAADLANKDYLTQVYSAIGAANIAEYLAFRKASMEELRAARRRLLKSARGRKELARLRRAQAAKTMAFFKTHGIDLNRVRLLQKEFQAGREALFSATLGRDEIVAAQPRKTRNQDYGPPFNGWSWALNQYTYKGDTDTFLHHNGLPATPTADVQTGNVGHVSNIGVEDASDCDEFNVKCRAAIIKVFEIPPPGGNVRVRILAKIASSSHGGHIEPEFSGISNVYVRQRMRFYARVLSPSLGWSPKVTWLAFDHKDEDIDEHDWTNDGWVGGLASGVERNFGPAVIPGSHSPGTCVAVEAGILHRNRFVTDDCEVNSGVSTFAHIKELGLSVAEFGDL